MSIERRIAWPSERVDTSTETACLSGLTRGILPVQPVVQSRIIRVRGRYAMER